ncbi:AI-2E family transporter [Embleya sp. NBC_00896]|uniref:AI-2E family transporter n=1 Tax=Embleya sp. NBC_00896 TaxID=2975961 RepID=UPI003868442F|nr:AI-2E family transporter [Embleya sp. NBC_00896]
MGRLSNIWSRARSGAPDAGAADGGKGTDGDPVAPAPDDAPTPDDAGAADDAAASRVAGPAAGDTTVDGSPAPVPAQAGDPDAAAASTPAPAGGVPRPAVDAPAPDGPAPALIAAKTEVKPWTGVGSRFGDPGQPLRRSSPFYIGFIGGLGLITAWFLAQAVLGIQHVLIVILISFFLAAGLNPFVERLERRGMARRWAVSAVAFGFVIVVAGFVTAIAQPLVEQTSSLINSIPESLTELLRNEQFKRLDEKYDIVDRAKEWAANANTAQNVAGGLWGFGKMVLTSVFDTLTVIVLTLYFLGALPSIKNHLYNLFPKSRRARVRLLGDEILSGIGGYVNGALIVATCAGLSSFIFLTVLGNDYALPLALVIAFTDLIPMIGATIGAAVVSVVVFFDSPGKALTCVIFFLAYQQFENYLIYPRVMKRAVNVPPAITVIAALVGGALLGVTGALLAIPIAAAVLLILREVVTPRQDQA